MHVQVDSLDLELPVTGSESVELRARRAFHRLRGSISRVAIRIWQEPGPTGAPRKLCMVRIHLAGGRQVLVIHRGRSLHRAIVGGLRRVRRLVTRELRRRHAPMRRRAFLRAALAMPA